MARVSTDRALAQLASEGDSTAFRELVARYENRVYRLALKMLRNEQDAEDVLQETFISAYRHLDSFRGEAEFSTWVYRIATNASLMKLRSRRPAQPLDRADEDAVDESLPRELIDWSATPEDMLLASEMRVQMDAALATVSEALRAVFVLRDIEGLSVEETAKVAWLVAVRRQPAPV